MTDQTITGTVNDDTLVDGSGNDTIFGGDGSDTITASTGTDTVFGGTGNDSIEGGAGADVLEGGNGNDSVYGGTENDTLRGNGGSDELFGGAGDDQILAGAGDDTIWGGDGNDTFDAREGADIAYGGTGNDFFENSSGDATFYGGDDSDTMEIGADVNTFFGGDGGVDSDTLSGYDMDDALTVSFTGDEAGTYTDIDGDSGTFAGVEVLDLTEQNDSVDGSLNTAGVTIFAHGGEDSFVGGNFRDTVFGGTGQDTLNGAGGNDDLYGGADDDDIIGGGAQDLLDGGAGNDNLWAGNGIDTVFGGADSDLIYGGKADDTLFGGDGDDTLYGGQGLDTLYGGAGDDVLAGNQHGDTLDGGEGSDTYQLDDADASNDNVVTDTGSTGIDVIELSTGAGSYRVQDNFSAASSGIEIIDGSGTTGDQLGTNDPTANLDFSGITLIGVDEIIGGTGTDTIIGSTGDDSISTYGGADRLEGGAGDDTLSGGTENDTFVIADGSGNDVITDFELPLGWDGSLPSMTPLDVLDVSGLTDASGDPVDWKDVTVSDDGSGNAVLTFPNGESVTLTGVAPSAVDDQQVLMAMGIPCFTPGTPIRTPHGAVAIETLRAGDLVTTADEGPQPVLWVGHSRCETDEARRRPIEVAPGALGNSQTLRVSPQHCFLIDAPDLPGEAPVFVRAKHLVGRLPGVSVGQTALGVRYIHLLFARHQVIFADGVATESFYPGPMGLRFLPVRECVSLLAAMPRLAHVLQGQSPVDCGYGPTARQVLRRRDLAHWRPMATLPQARTA
ncbi:MAG: Hint domain-containing protein [Pseudomonadota bacterium]